MSKFEELELLAALDVEADRQALRDLAAHLRAAVEGMSVQSRLALAFVRHASRFELWATDPRSPALMGGLQVQNLAVDARRAVDHGKASA